MTRVFNKKVEQPKRRQLRYNSTFAERTLWISLRKRQINNIRFLRQYSVNQFVLDFYAPEIKLGIELDGDSHIGKELYDCRRQQKIEEYGIKIIRFTDEEVLGNANKVVNKIENVIRKLL